MIQFTKRICCVYRGGTWCSGNVVKKILERKKSLCKGTARSRLVINFLLYNIFLYTNITLFLFILNHFQYFSTKLIKLFSR